MGEQRFDLYVNGDLAYENVTIEMAAALLKILFEYYYSESKKGVAITIQGRVADEP